MQRHHECIAAEALYSVLSHIQDLRQALKVLGCLVKLTVNELKDNASSKMFVVSVSGLLFIIIIISIYYCLCN